MDDFTFDFVSVLGVSDSQVYWTDFLKNPLAFCAKNFDKYQCWNLLSRVLEETDQNEAHLFYLNYKSEIGNKLNHERTFY